MSCFIVDQEHLRVMVHAAVHPYRLAGCLSASRESLCYVTPDKKFVQASDDNAGELGQMLLDANVMSVNDRYGDDDLFAYSHGTPRERWSPIEVIQACQCYMYQACEWEKWEGSEAERFTLELVNMMTRLLNAHQHVGVWEITPESTPEKALSDA